MNHKLSKTIWSSLVAACLLPLAASTAHAERIKGDPSDAMAIADATGKNQVINATKTPIRVGRFGSMNTAAVFVFQLPSIGNTSFKNAKLKLNVYILQHEGASTDFYAALYGLDARATSNVRPGDFHFGEEADTSIGVKKLQNNFLTPSTEKGTVASVDLSAWLNKQYDGGANAGKYVFLRVSATGSAGLQSGVKNGYMLHAAESKDNKPYINYQTAP